MARFGFNGDQAQIGELGDGSFPAEAAVATGFDPAEGHLRFVVNRAAIDMAHPRLDLFRDLQSVATSRLKTAAERPYSVSLALRLLCPLRE